MSRIKLTPVNGQIDTFDLTGADGQPISIATTPKSGGVIGCTETITLVHHIKDDNVHRVHDVCACFVVAEEQVRHLLHVLPRHLQLR